MTTEEMRHRYYQISAMKESFRVLQLRVRREFAFYGVTCLADLPAPVREEIEAQGSVLKTPDQLSAELDELMRECKSAEVVDELHRLYGIPDPRTAN